MVKICKPRLTISSIDDTASDYLNLVVNGVISYIAQINAPIDISLLSSAIPPNNTKFIQIVDSQSTISMPVFRHDGNILRVDSLYRYIRRNRHCYPFGHVTILNGFIGNDPNPRVLVFNKMCPSSKAAGFIPAPDMPIGPAGD